MKTSHCAACNADDNLFFHHLIPKSAGGSDEESNLITLCGACHAKIHGLKDTIWMSSIVKHAMSVKKANGQRVGDIPYGYELADDGVNLLPVQHEQDTLELIRNLRAKGTSYRKIANELEARGIETKKGRGTWQPKTILNLVNQKDTK